MNRRIAQLVSLVVAVSMVFAAIVMAGKPPKPGDTPIVATVTTQDFLDNVEGKVSSQTFFVLTVDVAGAVEDYKWGSRVRYRYKVGPATDIDPSVVSSYDYGGYESNPLIFDISDQPDGEMVLCLLGYEEILDSWGSVKKTVYQEEPTLYYWTKSTATPIRPSFTWLEPDGVGDIPDADGNVTLRWDVESADPDATIAFFYGDAFMGNLIDVVELAPDDESDTLVWNTTGVAPGMYFLCASVWENHGTTEFWSPFPVIVGSPPAADWSWQPESVVGIGTQGWEYQVEMDGQGSSMAVGSYKDDRGYVLNYSFHNGNYWSDAEDFVVIGDTNGVRLAPPILTALGPNKFLLVYMAWTDLFAIVFEGTAWDPVPQRIDEVYPTGESNFVDGVFNFDAAASDDGTSMIVWRNEASGDICTRFFNGLVWEPEVAHFPGIQPAIAADDAGNYMIAYCYGHTSSPYDWHLYSMHYDGAAMEWSPELPLDLDSLVSWPNESSYLLGESGPVRLAGAGSDKFVAVYSSWPVDGTAPRSNLKASHYDGSMWRSSALLDNQAGEIPTHYGDFAHITRVAMSSNGTALVIWTQDDGTNWVVYGSSFDGTEWAVTPTPLSYNTYGDAGTFYGGLTIDDQGNGIATFFDTPFADAYSVVKTHYIAGVGWQLQAVDDPTDRPTDREALSGPLGYSGKSRIAGQADGKAMLLFSPCRPEEFPVDWFLTLKYGN